MKKGEIINLDVAVLNALNFFSSHPVKKQNFKSFGKRLVVVGSGNAAVVGRVLFSGSSVLFADESNLDEVLDKNTKVTTLIIISASGGKHAPIMANKAKKRGLKVILLTNNNSGIAKKYADKIIVFPKIAEPYTYNTSSYMSMLLSLSGENPKNLLQFIHKNTKIVPSSLKHFYHYYILIPSKFEGLASLLQTKFDELFGPKISVRISTFEAAKHAKTVVPSASELFISFGVKNTVFGNRRLNLPLPSRCGPAGFMAWSYYVVGRIQAVHHPYFKENIARYVREASRLFKQKISVWVD